MTNMNVEQSDLPGIGTKYQFHIRHGSIFIISKLDGSKQLYFKDKEGKEHVLFLDEQESKIVGAILLNVYFFTTISTPKITIVSPASDEIGSEIKRTNVLGVIRGKKYIEYTDTIVIEPEDLLVLKM